MTTALIESLVYVDNGNINVVPEARIAVKKAVLAFLDMSSTATGQKTYYNKRSEQVDAMNAIHGAVFDINRGLYLAMLALPGVLDISIQEGVSRLLQAGYSESSILPSNEEAELIKLLSSNLKADRLLKMFGMICDKKINKSSVRTFILASIIGSKSLPWWSIKYRRHLQKALRYAWGSKYHPVIARILAGGIENAVVRDKAFIRKHVDRYATHSPLSKGDIYESICFVFGKDIEFKNDLFKARINAKEDLTAGSKLPPEVLEGIRGRHHKNVSKGRVLELSKDTMTDKQKMRSQRAAKKDNIELKFDASKLNSSDLYVYALKEGMNNDIRAALDEKASAIAATFPLKYKKVSVVVDNSASMGGTDHNVNRPLAIGLAMRDVLEAASEESNVQYTNGSADRLKMVKAGGDTSLAMAVALSLKDSPDAIYIITDGYENAPAGRVDEVIRSAKSMGIEVPIFQFNPTMATEASGVRQLSDELSVLPVSKPEGLGLSLIRATIEQDLERGLQALINPIIARIGAQNV